MKIFRAVWTGVKAIGTIFGIAGRATIALVGICGVGLAIANYAVTQGSGTNFGSIIVGGVHYAQQFICDLATPAQCASVSAGGAVKVDGSAVNQPVTGTFWQSIQPASLNTTPTVANGNAVVLAASATNGATPNGIVAANSNNSNSLKGGAGTVYGVQTSNINATTPYYLKLYDKATAPTCGTDTPVARFVIPPNFSGNNGVFPVGKKFTLGIGFCIVTGIADNDNTSVPAATILSNIDYN